MLVFRKLENVITGQINGTPFNLPRTLETEERLLELQEASKTEDLATEVILEYVKEVRSGEVAGSNDYLVFKPVTGEYFLMFEGKRSKIAIPKVLVSFIEDSFSKDIDFTPVLKAWLRLLDNPRYNSRMAEYFSNYLSTSFVDTEAVNELVESEDMDIAVATHICTYPDIAITQEGLLATYKVANIVTEEYVMEWDDEAGETGEFVKTKKSILKKTAPKLDTVTGQILEEGGFADPDFKEDYVFTPAICKNGDRFFSNNVLGYQYKVGQMQNLPEKATRNLDNTFGGGGLYIGGLNYVENYKNQGTDVLTCLVNPSDILSFQDSGQAIRVDALFVNNVWNNNVALKGKYHSSKYDVISTDRLEELLKNATAQGIDIAKEQSSYVGESKASN